ncbi:MAG TPA: F420-0--gamma-glutamyl ligase [Candidatus Avichristensenella intestinipullorum]|uniref:F420-0--gamma-glutamyl ligase n=1 Tax=Candidatus Avichristensenella intestinipullorum TaxID=2840693 RepID=A0A9D1CHE7_9FIRM|nr:F420-0--gamma-glutamyl ligase [Candidatus Avichristensenella intestinipullorum]
MPSRNLAEQRREEKGIVYYDRGVIQGEDGRQYDRLAIQTHFIQRGESQEELVRRYVLPLAQPGDVLSFGAKVMAMCVESVKTRDEVHPGFWANLLWRFAGINTTGVGMHEPYKMQLVIDMCGLPRVLLAAFLSAVTKPFGVHGVFYKVCGKGVGGIDGFYFRSSFDVYKEMALINPENPDGLCEALAKACGIPVVLMDANDLQRDQLGKSSDMPLSDAQLQDAMRDNPSGQGDELTPFILIRPL